MGGLQGIGKMLIGIGIALAVLGGLLWAAGGLGLGSLPGDLRFGNEKWSCYLPIATALLLSLLLTLVLNLVWRWFGN
ncbi:MAG: DUF2905 family protein [Actinomycetota bacterium]|nr:DUF2905 family protein [Actinomycetota bacterium]